MPPASTARGSAYLNALAVEIQKKLQRVRILDFLFIFFIIFVDFSVVPTLNRFYFCFEFPEDFSAFESHVVCICIL